MEIHPSKRCRSKTAHGKSCRMPRLKGTMYCFTHDPSTKEAREEARRKGGYAVNAPNVTTPEQVREFELRSPDDVVHFIELAARDALNLKNSPAKGRTVAALASAALKAIEVADLEVRLAALEEANNQRRTS